MRHGSHVGLALLGRGVAVKHRPVVPHVADMPGQLHLGDGSSHPAHAPRLRPSSACPIRPAPRRHWASLPTRRPRVCHDALLDVAKELGCGHV